MVGAWEKRAEKHRCIRWRRAVELTASWEVLGGELILFNSHIRGTHVDIYIFDGKLRSVTIKRRVEERRRPRGADMA